MTVKIVKTMTGEANVGDRSVAYDIYLNEEYHTTVNDILAALDIKEELESKHASETIKNTFKMMENLREIK